MQEQVDSLKASLAALMTKIQEVAANPKPNYSIDGQSVSWGEYLKMLTEQYKIMLELLQMIEPFELRTMVL